MIRRRMWSWARQIGRQPATTGRGATRVEVEGQVPLFLRRLAKLGAVICLLLAAGTLGFVVAEDSSPWTAFVWTLDTIATVDAIPSPETTGGQVVKVLLIVLGVGTLFYCVSKPSTASCVACSDMNSSPTFSQRG